MSWMKSNQVFAFNNFISHSDCLPPLFLGFRFQYDLETSYLDPSHKILQSTYLFKLNYLLGNLILASFESKNQPNINLAGILNKLYTTAIFDVSNANRFLIKELICEFELIIFKSSLIRSNE